MRSSLLPAIFGFLALAGSIVCLVGWQWILVGNDGVREPSEGIRIYVRTGRGDRSEDWAPIGKKPPLLPGSTDKRPWVLGEGERFEIAPLPLPGIEREKGNFC